MGKAHHEGEERRTGILVRLGGEEWEPACYQLPAHRLQLAHGISAAQLVVFIKAWTEAEGKKDQEILDAAVNPQARWPWTTSEDFGGRFAEAKQWQIHRDGVTKGRRLEIL